MARRNQSVAEQPYDEARHPAYFPRAYWPTLRMLPLESRYWMPWRSAYWA